MHRGNIIFQECLVILKRASELLDNIEGISPVSEGFLTVLLLSITYLNIRRDVRRSKK